MFSETLQPFSRLDGLFVLLPDLVAVDDSQHSCSNAQDDKDGYKTDFSLALFFIDESPYCVIGPIIPFERKDRQVHLVMI